MSQELIAVGFIICAASVSVTYCVVKSLGQCEQSRCEEVSTKCFHIKRNLNHPAALVRVGTPAGPVSVDKLEQVLVPYDDDDRSSDSSDSSASLPSEGSPLPPHTPGTNRVKALARKFGGT